MHLLFCFINIGFYHRARINATAKLCKAVGWKVSAIQLTSQTLAHPWGKIDGCDFELVTLSNQMENSEKKLELPKIEYKYLKSTLDHLNPDVIFIPGWSFDLSRKIMYWNKKKKVPLVVMTESKKDDQPRWFIKELIKSWFFIRKISGALVGGQPHLDYMTSLGIKASNIRKGYDAVDNKHFEKCAQYAREHEEEIRSQFPTIPKQSFFLLSSRMIERKNLIPFLDAYYIYVKKISNKPNALVICGDGDLYAQIKDKINFLGLDELVHLPGFLLYDEISYLYGLAKAFVHPALDEQWGLVINEACAAGLPILCSKTVGARYELVRDGINGLVFDPKNIADMADSLIKMHKKTPDECREMSIASQRIVDEFSPEKFGRSAIELAELFTKQALESKVR